MTPWLPLELVNCILEFLPYNPPNSLLSCALVCRCWRPVAERLLWSRLILTTRKLQHFERTLGSIAQLTLATPLFCTWIRELEIGRGTQRLESVLSSVSQFPALERLSLSQMSFIGTSTPSVRLLNNLLLTSPIHSLQLHDVTFQNPSSFASLFTLAPGKTFQLTDLALFDVRFLRIKDREYSTLTRWSQSPLHPPPSNDGICTLLNLSVLGGMAPRLLSILHDLSNNVDLRHLQAVKYMDDWDEPHDMSTLASLLEGSPTTLRHLTLFAPSVPLSPENTLSLEQFTLQTLCICGLNNHSIANALGWVKTLASKSDPCTLTYLGLQYHFPSYVLTPALHSSTDSKAHWSSLESLLQTPSFSNVEDIEFRYPKHPKQTNDDVDAAIAALTPQLMAKKGHGVRVTHL